MRKLFDFLYRNRAVLLFLLLELYCIRLLIGSHRYQETHWLNSSNAVAASLLALSQSTNDYFGLRETNEVLAQENARLRRELAAFSSADQPVASDSSSGDPFDFITARVVDNTTGHLRNFITINRGSQDGIAAGMAVSGQSGIVGKVKAVSLRYAVVISLLNVDEHVSVQIKRTGNFGTLRWDGADPALAQFHYLPRHASVWPGDTVVTSGYNAVFPRGMRVGVVRSAELDESSLFYRVQVELAQDFSRLQFVDVIRSRRTAEIDSLKKAVGTP